MDAPEVLTDDLLAEISGGPIEIKELVIKTNVRDRDASVADGGMTATFRS